MELQKFISESIKQICFGIKDAREEVSGIIGNYPIAPAFVENEGREKIFNEEAQEICFDIAVTITKDNKINAIGDIGIKAIGMGFGAKKEVSDKNENINRISFKIPFYPQFLHKK